MEILIFISLGQYLTQRLEGKVEAAIRESVGFGGSSYHGGAKIDDISDLQNEKKN